MPYNYQVTNRHPTMTFSFTDFQQIDEQWEVDLDNTDIFDEHEPFEDDFNSHLASDIDF
jgi:hypothetical protein